MKSAGFLDRMDDLLNPIVVKELRQAVKSRIVLAALMLFLLIELIILLLSLSWDENRMMDPMSFQAGRKIFEVLQGILLGTCLLLIPTYAGIRLASEHSDTNVDLLFISTLRPRGIIAGKLQASIVLILLIFSACAPFMTFTYLLRGIDVPSILLLLVLDFLVVLLATQGAIFLGAVPANMGLKLLLGLMGVVVLITMLISTIASTNEMLDLGLGSRLDTVEFWLIAGAVVIALVATMGLLFTWSVAIVSPPSANRALPVRLYVLGFWLVTGGIAALLTRRFREPAPLYLWECAIMVLLCSQIIVSINEREQWGLRVRRTIPRRALLRGPAFLMYSGAAGGVLLAVLLIALTLLFLCVPLHAWIDPSPLLERFENDITPVVRFTLLLIALYTFDYCLTAVWLRTVLFPGRIKATYTWVLALILWALGSSLPFPLLFLFNNEEWRMGRVNPWWQISNPLSTILTCSEIRNQDAVGFREPCLMFLSIWGLLISLACLPWIFRQMKLFRPPKKETLAVQRP
jgi:hypothetical protein